MFILGAIFVCIILSVKIYIYIYTHTHTYINYTPLARKCKNIPHLVTTAIYSAVLFYLYFMFPVLAISVVRLQRTHRNDKGTGTDVRR